VWHNPTLFSRHLHVIYVKVKLFLCFFLTEHHAMKVYWESGAIAPCILELSTRWSWVVSFMSWPLYPQGKSPWYPLDRRLGGLQSWSGHSGEEKNSQPLPRLKPPIIQAVGQCYTTELSWLMCHLCITVLCGTCDTVFSFLLLACVHYVVLPASLVGWWNGLVFCVGVDWGWDTHPLLLGSWPKLV
jgi:hypothetical protein